MSEIKLSIIIINYRTCDMTAECLESIFAAGILASYEVIVVDNDSQDGSYEELSERFAGKATVLQSGENGGFSKGNNIGARQARGRYLFFFNSDTLLKPLVLDEMLSFMDCEPACGALTSQSVDAAGRYHNNGHAFPTPLTMAKEVYVRPLVPARLKAWRRKRRSKQAEGLYTRFDWVSGSGLLMRACDFEAIGGWDEDYFMYMEDVSLCQEVARLGKFSVVYNKVGFVHYLGDGAGSARVVYEASRSEVVYYRKYRPADASAAKRLTIARAKRKCTGALAGERAGIVERLRAL